ncbi:MAG: hypothetical protein EHM35_06645, partial [Planctomycetaceae bacterium]
MAAKRGSCVLQSALVVIALSLPDLPAHAKYGGGAGEPNDPYLIYTAEQINAIGVEPNDWGGHFKLMADIDLGIYTGTTFNIIGQGWNADGAPRPFRGVFDGNDHTISHFTWTSTGKVCVGLFGFVGDPNAQIKNLRLVDVSVDGGNGHSIGALVGTLANGTIVNCRATGNVNGEMYVGGLIGDHSGRLVNCHTDGVVRGTTWIGGLIGYSGHGSITACYSNSSVTGSTWVGGLAGYINGEHTTSCYATGSVAGVNHVGGLA